MNQGGKTHPSFVAVQGVLAQLNAKLQSDPDLTDSQRDDYLELTKHIESLMSLE
jgi:hypothetical protein